MPVFLRWFLNLGPTNPVVVRLVQGGSKRLRHLYLRAGYLAVLIIVLLWTLLIASDSGSLSYRELAAAGATSFQYVAYLQVGLICLISPLFMAGAIAQEANPKTWDILLTTPLTASQIVLGNLTGRLFFVMALLVASLPLFAVTQYFGGVPGRAIFLSYAIAALAALDVGAIAIALCVSRVAGRRAVFIFYIAVVTYLALTAAIDGATSSPGHTGFLTPLNPFLTLRAVLNPSRYAPLSPDALTDASWITSLWFGSPVSAFALVSGAGAGVLILFSIWSVRSATVRGLRLKRGTPAGSGAGRSPRHVGSNPIAWREAESRGGASRQLGRWGFLTLGLLWALGVLAAYHAGAIAPDTLRFTLTATVWAESLVITLVAIVSASSAIAAEREDGTLDLLLTTPLTPAAYLGGKARGLIRFLGPMLAVPILTLAFPALYVLAGGFGGLGPVTTPQTVGTITMDLPVVLPVAVIVAPLTSIPFVAFCVVGGLQWSLKSRGVIGATVGAFSIILAVSVALGMCGWNAGSDISYLGPMFSALTPVTAAHACINPATAVTETLLTDGHADAANAPLAIGSLFAAAVYLGLALVMKNAMVRSFDTTVRRLAGTARSA